jgi:hypothetical protein
MVCNVKKEMFKVIQNVKMNKQIKNQSVRFCPTHDWNQA